MSYEEYINHCRALDAAKQALKNSFLQTVTKLKVGDTVRYIRKGDSYIGEKDEKITGEIYAFDVYAEGKVSAKIGHDTIPIDKLKRVKAT